MLIRVPVVVSTLVWGLVLFLAVQIDGVPTSHTLAAVAFFLSLLSAAVHFLSVAVRVDSYGIVYQGLRTDRVCCWEDIVRVRADVLWPVSGYLVVTRLYCFAFSSFFGGHERLFELIRERARLSEPLRA